MASFFGEVVYPNSRAFWIDEDDEDFDDVQQTDQCFSVNWIDPEPQEINTLLIVEGGLVIDFIRHSLLADAKCVCDIKGISSKDKSEIYQINDLFVCMVDKKLEVDKSQTGKFTETILPIIKKSKKILSLTNDHISHYKSSDPSFDTSFIRSLHSSKAALDQTDKVPILSSPNIVSGICAGVLSCAEILDIHCTLYVAYFDAFTLDSKNSSELTHLFSDLLNRPLPKFIGKGCGFFEKGNLYM